MFYLFKTKEDKQLIDAINFILGYKTSKPELYKLALLHKSIKTEESNERLEFLGDAILGLIVAKHLFKLYPFKDEGFLTKIRSKIVSSSSWPHCFKSIRLILFSIVSKIITALPPVRKLSVPTPNG